MIPSQNHRDEGALRLSDRVRTLVGEILRCAQDDGTGF
jgi:hypothetical protein